MARTTADVTTIGGGIAGLSVAAALAGEASVIVLEAEDGLARHTSGRSAQQMQPTYGPEPVRALTAATLALMPAIEEELGERILSPRPLIVGGHRDQLAELHETTPGFRALDLDAVHELLPFLRRGAFEAAAIDDASREVRVPSLLRWYEERARERDARILTGWRVREVQRKGSSWHLETEGGDVATGFVVNAAGAWADQVAALCRVRPRGLQPLRRTVAIASIERGRVPVDAPMLALADDSVYLRPHEEGLLASPMEDEPSGPEDARPREALVDETLRRATALTDLGLEARRSWTGLRVETPDHAPVMGRDGDAETFLWLAGQSGYGIQTSAASARMLAAELLETAAGLGDAADAAWASLDPNRASLVG